MKAILVYYSLEGSTELVAKAIAAKTGAKLLRLKPVREYPSKGFFKYMIGGAGASMKLKPKLTNGDIDFTRYDTVILGTPMWAGTITPPLLTLLSGAKLSGKKIGAFVCNRGADPAKCFARLDGLLAGNTVLTKQVFTNAPALSKADLDGKVSAFCASLTGKA
jgi:flavodoxin